VQNTPTHWISSNVPASGYIPGTTYTVTCKAVSTVSGQNSNFGFECTPENKSGKLLGTLANIVTSGAHSTQIISSSPSKWVTHTSGSYQATDSTTWSFQWTAPNPAVGAVEFYATFNCGSGDSRTTAQIYRDSIHIDQDSTAGIDQLTAFIDEVKVYPNPVNDKLTVTYVLKAEATISINIIAMDGKKVCSLLSNCKQGAGGQNGTYSVNANLKQGTYLLEIREDEGAIYQKILVIVIAFTKLNL
jgi:hypothetical protein